MSGVLPIKAETIELLADNPIVGPTPSMQVTSVNTNTGSGHRTAAYRADLNAPQVAPAGGGGGGINFSSLAQTALFPAGYVNSQIPFTNVQLVAGQVVFTGVQYFKGRAILDIQFTTSAAGPGAAPENVLFEIFGLDNLGGSYVARKTVPITAFGVPSFCSVTLELLIPYISTRTGLNIYATVSNGQAAATLTLSGLSFIEIITD